MSITLKNDAGTFSTNLNQSNPTANVNIALPTTSGTMAMTSQLGRRKNYLINGNFDMWQRGTSFTAGGYTADRWLVNQVGGNVNVASIYVGTNSAFLGAKTAWQGTPQSGVTAWNLVQRIEGVESCAGKTVTLSFTGAVSSGTLNLTDGTLFASRFNQNFGSGGSADVPTFLHTSGNSIILTTTPQVFKVTVTLPSISGKTVGSSSYLELLLQSSTINIGQTMYIAEVKLEDGSVATDGWHPYDGEFGGEVQACQRYYEVLSCSARFYSTGATQIMTTNVYFKSKKRVIPTIVQTGGTRFNISTIAFGLYPTLDGGRLEITSQGIGDTYSIGERIEASAEL